MRFWKRPERMATEEASRIFHARRHSTKPVGPQWSIYLTRVRANYQTKHTIPGTSPMPLLLSTVRVNQVQRQQPEEDSAGQTPKRKISMLMSIIAKAPTLRLQDLHPRGLRSTSIWHGVIHLKNPTVYLETQVDPCGTHPNESS